MNLGGKFKDHPVLITGLLACVTLAHLLASRCWSVLAKPADRLSESSAAGGLYIGTAGVVAITAGFAGVIIVFAMSRDNAAFAKMRRVGGPQLRSNWLALITSPSLSAMLLLMAALLDALNFGRTAAWVYQFALLVAIHVSLRLVWLFKRLLRAVAEEDAADASQQTAPTSLAALLQQQTAGG